MGYIKKLKNNELVGGTDKTTIYPVTSTEAVFEEITNGNESSFKSQKTINKEQQDELDDHEERIQAAEAEDIKSITINGSTKKFEVDAENNVDLTIYTVDSDPDMPDIADNVRDLRNMVGTSTPVLETSHKTRIENLETTVGTGGTIDSRIATTKAELEEQIAGKQKTLSVGSGITLTSDGVISATADPTIGKVVETRPTTDIIDGMIYLVQKANTPGTYVQWVHYGNDWTNKGEISLGITADDAIDSTSTNPIQNNAITAQIGYFVCSASGSSAIKNVDAPSYSPSDVGGAFKIKMNYTNTCSDTVYLQFNSDSSTKKELKYNREPVTPTNTWDSTGDNKEVISVYYDGTCYQASNAMGGGSAVGKKVIKPTATNRAITTNGDTIGAVITGSATNWCYAKYAVNEGDVVMISGTGGSSPRLWAIADTSENILSKEETINVTREDFVLVMPAGAKWIVINNNNNLYPSPKWYYAKAGSVGAHEMQTEAYLYGGLRTLAVGQTYNIGEAVKTTDKQLLKIIKEVGILNRTDEVAVGDLKVYGRGNTTATYKALQAVNIYTGNDSDYESGDYAIGNYSKYELTVTAATDAGTITVNGIEIEVTENESASDIASAISNDVTIEGWTLSADDDVVTVKCNTVGNKTTAITFNAGDTGVTLSGNDTLSVAGTTVVRTFDGTEWTNVAIADYVASSVWTSITVSELQTLTTSQNTLNSYFKIEKSVAGFITAKGNTSQCLYRNIRLEKGRTYTVYLKARGAVSQTSGTFFLRGGLITDKIPCNETNNNDEIAITNQNLANGFTLTFTPKENVSSAALWMWLNNYATSIYIIDYAISWTEYVNTFEEKVEWDKTQKEELEYTTVTKTIGPIVSSKYVQAKANITNFGGLETAINNAYHVTDYIDCLGAKKLATILIRTKGFNAGLVFYDADKKPIVTDFDYCLWNTSAGYTGMIIIDVPENAAYFRNSTWESSWNYTFYYNRDISEQVGILTNEVDSLIKKTETIPDGMESYDYEGEKISFTPRFAAQQLFESPGSLQGCANYDKYLFMLSLGTRTLNIYDLTTNNKIGTLILPEFERSNTHGNTLTFSNQFVESEDAFPILYLTSGYHTSGESHVYGYRIIKNGNIFTATLVKTIVFVGEETNWTEMLCDNVNSKIWILREKDDTREDFWYYVDIPSLSEARTTINLNALTYNFVIYKKYNYGQSHLYHNQRIYIPQGKSNGKLYVIDTNRGQYVTTLDLSNITSSEPEGVCIYDGHLYIMFASAVYKIYLS